VQPALAGFLFTPEEIASGTPQRFLMFSTVDPNPPSADEVVEHPGRIAWEPPRITDRRVCDEAVMIAGVGRRWIITVDPEVQLAVRRAHLERLGGPPCRTSALGPGPTYDRQRHDCAPHESGHIARESLISVGLAAPEPSIGRGLAVNRQRRCIEDAVYPETIELCARFIGKPTTEGIAS
jgi:hypothetical protein